MVINSNNAFPLVATLAAALALIWRANVQEPDASTDASAEIRARSLVLVDDEGNERMRLSASRSGGNIRIQVLATESLPGQDAILQLGEYLPGLCGLQIEGKANSMDEIWLGVGGQFGAANLRLANRSGLGMVSLARHAPDGTWIHVQNKPDEEPRAIDKR